MLVVVQALGGQEANRDFVSAEDQRDHEIDQVRAADRGVADRKQGAPGMDGPLDVRAVTLARRKRFAEPQPDPEQVEQREEQGDKGDGGKGIDAVVSPAGARLHRSDDSADGRARDEAEPERHPDEAHALGAILPRGHIGHRRRRNREIAAHGAAEEPRHDEQPE